MTARKSALRRQSRALRTAIALGLTLAAGAALASAWGAEAKCYGEAQVREFIGLPVAEEEPLIECYTEREFGQIISIVNEGAREYREAMAK